MLELELLTLPVELRQALERAWPDCPEAQRRALLGPWAAQGWRSVWPGQLWPWQGSQRWWRAGQARTWRASFEHFFSAQRSNLLQTSGPRLFDPDQPFFATPWTLARVLLCSPVPEVFSDAEYWAATMQLFGGDADLAASEMRGWAATLQQHGATARGMKRDRWWQETLAVMRASASGDLGSL
ncbi:hypothetical protein RQP53_16750 [Paucibacter sp. APW11]|uniref:Uncharacterized protein n=1 Tax=Roseateles aquae TaxID=3077235 RepID=A0ABU3PFQ6_9BURK|nr:hypothetical protein [Paucibacter sp. APW11]MDT9000928.1 hypothetical protein [Paucibacter sp. APW11]